MPKLTIDGQPVTVETGATILEAAGRCGIDIPTLCHAPGLPCYTSCMICGVTDRRSGRTLPACSAPAEDGMDLDASSAAVVAARREILELLLSDHVGDCEEPCRRICPARLPVARMIRAIRAGRNDEAAALTTDALLFPRTLSRVCTAPCEKGCRRNQVDEGLSIRALHGFAVRTAAAPRPPLPPADKAPAAVVGAGPAGLAAAWHLRLGGHPVTVFEAWKDAGGMLRYGGIDPSRLPPEDLEADLAPLLSALDVRVGVRIGDDLARDDLLRDFGAVILATGAERSPAADGLAQGPHGLLVDAATRATSDPRVFAAGDCTRAHRMSVRAVADGRAAAKAAARRLADGASGPERKRFNSRFGRLHPCEAEFLVKDRNRDGRTPVPPGGYSAEEALREAARCLDCDCRRQVSCKLRQYAEQYGADQDRYKPAERRKVDIVRDHATVSYEPGKCIRCGLCIRAAAKAGEALGLAFIGRGYDERVGVPFDAALHEGLTFAADACVSVCPTAALSFADTWENDDDH